jgi:hypothetical protein
MARIGFLVRNDLLDAGHFQESSVDAVTWSLSSMGKVVSNSGRGSAADPDTTGECITGAFMLRLLVVVGNKMLISTIEVEFEFVEILTLVMDGRWEAKCAASSVDRVVTTAKNRTGWRSDVYRSGIAAELIVSTTHRSFSPGSPFSRHFSQNLDASYFYTSEPVTEQRYSRLRRS